MKFKGYLLWTGVFVAVAALAGLLLWAILGSHDPYPATAYAIALP